MSERQAPPEDGGSIPTPSLQISQGVVKIISKTEAATVIKKHHYSGNVPAGKNFYFGWYFDGNLYAVAVYGIGANSRLPLLLARVTSYPVSWKNLLELKRLARIEPKVDSQPLSKFLAICHRMLYKRGYRYVASFSDPDYNPYGGIYAASNFTLIGMTSNHDWDILNRDGKKIGRRTLFHWRKKNGNPSIADACLALGYTAISSQPKKRWFLNIGGKNKSPKVFLDTDFPV
jgi:hypothetical protein